MDNWTELERSMADPNRKQRRANDKRVRKSGDNLRILPARLNGQIAELSVLGGFANHVSVNQTGLPTTKAGSLSSMVFAKCCAHARSIAAVSKQSSMFDHHAIMALARMIMEASTMIAYLHDPVDPVEWEFRYILLRLHDTVARIKLMRGFELPADDLKIGREKLRAELEAHPMFLKLAEDRQKRLASGEDMFAIGMRSVATKIMGWNDRQFNGVYAYFSAHAHSAPMSFMRMEHHKM
ncbi:MAG: hypothetical protein IBJ13_05570 [Sphingopyxis sp.]|nr:hypothetical protein [Sphingopyxis sp.]